jgi:hypothetical protein
MAESSHEQSTKATILNSNRDMGWPDLLVSDAMVMMAADDCRE